MSQKDITWSLDVLTRAAQHEQLRLKRGLMRRQQMAEAIERGEEPVGPRAEWLKVTAHALLDTLQTSASVFNDKHQDDLISAADMGDALGTCINMLQKSGK